MLPLYLLTSAKQKPILIELKSNETINGVLINCDSWMNLTLSNCIKVDAAGENFVKYPEIYVRGNQIKYVRLGNDIIDQLKESQAQDQQNNNKRRGYNNSQQGGRYNNNNNNNNNNNRRYNQQGGRFNNRGGSNSSSNGSNNRGKYNNQAQQQQQPVH